MKSVVTSVAKTNIYNVVILDMSGSMITIEQQAINGYNEMLQTIQEVQRQYAETQNHFVTLVTFNSTAAKTVYDRIASLDAEELTDKDYRPRCSTPLYDAMGTTLSNFRQSLGTESNYKVLVTIITDGQENNSDIYDGSQINLMVTELKTLGWTFTYIGSNHDVEAFANSIAVPNALRYDSSKRGTKEMFAKESKSRRNFYDKIAQFFSDDSLQNAFFDEDKEPSEKS